MITLPKFDLYWNEQVIERWKCVNVEADTVQEAWDRMWDGEINEWPEVIDRSIIDVTDFESEEV